MDRVNSLISQNYFGVSKYPSGKNSSSLLYSQGNNLTLVQIEQLSPVGQSNPLRIFVSIKPKSSDNNLKVNEREAKIKSILETFIRREEYCGAQLKMNLVLMQEGQTDIFSSLVNAALVGLLKAGIQMKSTFFAFELFFGEGNDISVFNANKASVKNQIFIVLDIVNNLIGMSFISGFLTFKRLQNHMKIWIFQIIKLLYLSLIHI